MKEWPKLQPISHATTRLIHIPAELVRVCVPEANAKTILRGRWSVGEENGKKVLVLEIKKTDK